MKGYKRTAAGAAVLVMMFSSVFSCSSVEKAEGDTNADETAETQAATEEMTDEEGEFVKAEQDDEMAITWLSDYDLNPAKGEKRSAALEIFEDVFGGKINYISVSEDKKYDRLAEMIDAGEEVDMFPYELGAFPEGLTRNLYDSLDPYYEELGMDTHIWDDMQEVIDMYSVNGQHYVIPFGFSNPIVLTYSRKTIQDEGLSDPYELYKNGEWNWDTFTELMDNFVQNQNDGIKRYGISGEFGRAALASSGQAVVKSENGTLVNNISNPAIAKAEEMVMNVSSQGLYESSWHEHFDTDGNILFYAMGTWALGESNAVNEGKDLMVVPFPKAPDSDRYYVSCDHNARLLAKNSQKGRAVATYIRCERLAETEPTFADDRKKLATTPLETQQGAVKSVVTEEQYDALQDVLNPQVTFPIFDFGYGMGKNMYNYMGEGVMYCIDKQLPKGSYESWESVRDVWSETINGELARFNQ